MLGVFTDNADDTFAFDDFAFVADFFYRRSYFHNSLTRFKNFKFTHFTGQVFTN